MTRRVSLTQLEIARILRAVQAGGWDDPELTFHANGSVTVRNGRGKQGEPLDCQGDGPPGQEGETVEYL